VYGVCGRGGRCPLFGLYTGIIPTIIGSLLGSSRFLVTGPSNATALVTANVLQPFAGQAGYLEAVFALALLSGAIKLALGLLNLGWLIRYISHHVLIGFLTGASILIVLGSSIPSWVWSLVRAATPQRWY